MPPRWQDRLGLKVGRAHLQLLHTGGALPDCTLISGRRTNIGAMTDPGYGLLRTCAKNRQGVIRAHRLQTRQPVSLVPKALPQPPELFVRISLRCLSDIERLPVRIESAVPDLEQVRGQTVTNRRFSLLTEEPQSASLPAHTIGTTLRSGGFEWREWERRHDVSSLVAVVRRLRNRVSSYGATEPSARTLNRVRGFPQPGRYHVLGVEVRGGGARRTRASTTTQPPGPAMTGFRSSSANSGRSSASWETRSSRSWTASGSAGGAPLKPERRMPAFPVCTSS